MELSDRFYSILVDEMEIKPQMSFDKNRSEMFGTITLGNSTKEGNKSLVVLIRCVKHTWKQLVGAHVTNQIPFEVYFWLY